MRRILVCSNVQAAAEKIAHVLIENGYEVRIECEQRAASEACGGFDAAVFIFSSLREWEETIRFFSLETPLGLLALAKEGGKEEASIYAELGIPVLPFTTPCKTFLFGLEFATKSGERLRAMGYENRKLKDTISDLKLVDRAKCALIQYLNMTEADAHRFIEKQAMNKRLSKREIALQILNAYES